MFALPRKDYICFLVFNIVFWVVTVGSILLFSFSFGAVPVGQLGLYYNHFYDQYGSLQDSGRYLDDPFVTYSRFNNSQTVVLMTNLSCSTKARERMQVNASFSYRLINQVIRNMTDNLADQYPHHARSIVTNLLLKQLSATQSYQSLFSGFEAFQGRMVKSINQAFDRYITRGTEPIQTAVKVSGFWITSIRLK